MQPAAKKQRVDGQGAGQQQQQQQKKRKKSQSPEMLVGASRARWGPPPPLARSRHTCTPAHLTCTARQPSLLPWRHSGALRSLTPSHPVRTELSTRADTWPLLRRRPAWPSTRQPRRTT